MAELDLTKLTERDLQSLQAALDKQQKKRNKVDWADMTDEERSFRNRTVEPATPDKPTPKHRTDPGYYPRVIYGNVSGQVVGAEVSNAEKEDELIAKYPDANWQMSLLAHGIETSPSKPSGHIAAGFQHFGAGRVMVEANPAVDVVDKPHIPMEIPKMPVAETHLTHGDKVRLGREKAKAARQAA